MDNQLTSSLKEDKEKRRKNKEERRKKKKEEVKLEYFTFPEILIIKKKNLTNISGGYL